MINIPTVVDLSAQQHTADNGMMDAASGLTTEQIKQGLFPEEEIAQIKDNMDDESLDSVLRALEEDMEIDLDGMDEDDIIDAMAVGTL